MGQYWKPINIENIEWVYSHDFDNGLKLMEHSYIGNNFVGVVMKLLTKGQRWYKYPLVWCGDYFSEDGEENYYSKAEGKKKITPKEWLSECQQRKAILVNHTKRQYVSLAIRPKFIKQKVVDRLDGNDSWDTHPLPLLTALGNGRGGGDYSGTNENKVGIWARDIISVEFEIPEGYKELKISFKEK